jgi:hypothetical protein
MIQETAAGKEAKKPAGKRKIRAPGLSTFGNFTGRHGEYVLYRKVLAERLTG